MTGGLGYDTGVTQVVVFLNSNIAYYVSDVVSISKAYRLSINILVDHLR